VVKIIIINYNNATHLIQQSLRLHEGKAVSLRGTCTVGNSLLQPVIHVSISSCQRSMAEIFYFRNNNIDKR